MAPKKMLIRSIVICLMAALLAGIMFSTRTSIVQAKEVFLEVQKIRDEIIKDPADAFMILEIVDETSRYGEVEKEGEYEKLFDADNFPGDAYLELKEKYENGTIADYEQLKEEIADSISLGKEEIGFLIGGSEPYLEMYTDLIELSQGYSGLQSVNQWGELQTPEIPQVDLEIFQAAYEALIEKISEDYFSNNNAAPLVKEKVDSYQPNAEGCENYLRMVCEAPDEIEEGYMVEDSEGAYVWVENVGKFVYIGDEYAIGMLQDYNFDMKEEESEEEEFEEEESEEEESEEEESEEEESEEEESEEEESEEEESEEEFEEEPEEKPGVEEPEKEPEKEPEAEPEEEEPEAEPEEEPEITEAFAGWKKEVVFGKQIRLMSQNTSTQMKRYHFYAIDELTPEEAKEPGVFKVAKNPDPNHSEVKKIDQIYQFTFLGIKNNEWFRNQIFGLELNPQAGEKKTEDLRINVVTCTPDDEALEEKIRQADLVYINISASGILSQTNKDILVDKITGDSKLPCIMSAETYEMLDFDDTNINHGHFVKDNVYVMNHAINSVRTDERLYELIKGSDLDAAFEDVYYKIEQENYKREQQGMAELSTDVTPAVAIQTILTYTNVPVVIEKSNLTILELQPCYSFTYAGSEAGMQAFKEKFLPEDSTVNVEIIGMTTSEFCGKIEDINVKYDMIYIGSNTDLMNRIQISENDYCTVYNDFNMYGIVYSHMGDLCHLATSHAGLLTYNECNTYRYSGNDILASQEEQLLDFLKSKAPIVVENDFFVKNQTGEIIRINSGDTQTTVTDAAKGNISGITRQGILDSSSYIYQFVKKACVNTGANYGEGAWEWEKRYYQNFISADEIQGEHEKKSFAKWLNQPKMTIHMMSQPTEYYYTTRMENGCSVIADSSYLMPESGDYYLTYEFSISNLSSVDVANTEYEVVLWIDTNMDGRFSDNSENLSEENLVVQNMETGEIVSRDALKTGVHYRVRKELPEEIVGALPWKLVVRDKENTSIRSAVTGLTAIKREEKPRIRVLQLYQGNSNIQAKMQDPNNIWHTLLANVPDFNVEVTSIDASGYFSGRLQESLDNYDMLVVGFADLYQNGNSSSFSKERLDAIIEYADSGKCVLFSHDNTNWKNNSNVTQTLNMYIRDETGLDRFGATIHRNTGGEPYSNNKIKNGVSVPENGWAASKEELTKLLFDDTGMSSYKRDIAFAINTEQRQMDSRTQGITYSGNEHDRLGVNSKSSYIVYNNQTYGDYYRYLNFQNAPQNTWGDVEDKAYTPDYEVEKNNKGAITEYPYRLKEKIDIASTHGQYYQLDLDSDKDGDGEGDVVVWYTLNNSVAGDMNDIYNYSPNDVRNNYYIYNRGNITYTGMGHETIQNEEEIKLFINTMVAAYRGSILPPRLNIIEGNNDTTEKSFDTIPFDAQIGSTASFYKVYFKAQDINLVSSSAKNIQCRFYVEGGTQDLVVEGETIQVSEKTNQAQDGWILCESATGTAVPLQYSNSTDTYYYPLVSGREYYVQIPLVGVTTKEINLSEQKSVELYIEVQSIVQKHGRKNISAYIYDSFKLSQLKLFDLD